MSVRRFDMELVEYRDGDAYFEYEQFGGGDVSLVLPLHEWDSIGRPAVIRVTVAAAER